MSETPERYDALTQPENVVDVLLEEQLLRAIVTAEHEIASPLAVIGACYPGHVVSTYPE